LKGRFQAGGEVTLTVLDDSLEPTSGMDIGIGDPFDVSDPKHTVSPSISWSLIKRSVSISQID